MVLTFAMVYLGGWLVTAAVTYVASRRLADPDTTPLESLCFSILAGLVWPMLVLGAVEFSSLAVYSSAKSMRPEPVPDSWLGEGVTRDVVVPLR